MNSIKFKHIGSNTTKMLLPIIGNQNFLRMITYLTDDPFSLQTYNRQGNLINQPDIVDIPIGTNIILTPYNSMILTDLKVIIFINPLRGNLLKSVSDDIYEFLICCPLDYWILNGSGEFRPFLLGYEICQSIDNQNIAGIGKVEVGDWRVVNINEKYAGLSFMVNVSNATKS